MLWLSNEWKILFDLFYSPKPRSQYKYEFQYIEIGASLENSKLCSVRYCGCFIVMKFEKQFSLHGTLSSSSCLVFYVIHISLFLLFHQKQGILVTLLFLWCQERGFSRMHSDESGNLKTPITGQRKLLHWLAVSSYPIDTLHCLY